jgi:two-component system chemotaxis sensor kinase CheA
LGLDLTKYRKLFLEEAAEHLAEISSALLALEKDSGSVPSIDVIFRMAHSIKSMAASLEYESVAELAHALEDRMEGVRARGRIAGEPELASLFRGLEGLEAMVAVVRETAEPPPARPDLVQALRGATELPAARPEPKKKLLSSPGPARRRLALLRRPARRRRCGSAPRPSTASSAPSAR